MIPSPPPHVHVIGAGPAGLMAAQILAEGGARVTVHDRMPSAGRKLLMAGRGGLNLTHSEDPARFPARYGPAATRVAAWLAAFSPADAMAWAEGLGQPVFTGSSGRVFPRAMKASPLLRAWLARLADAGVALRLRSRWTGWTDDGDWRFETPDGQTRERPDAVVLALGGASWPRLGSDGAWTPWLDDAGATIVSFRPANAGFDVAWSAPFRDRFAGHPLKSAALTHAGRTVRGEAMIAAYGLEGGAIYALSAALRDAVARNGTTTLHLDLKPDLDPDALAARLARGRAGASLTNRLRAAGLSPVAAGLLREAGPVPAEPAALAARIKETPLILTGVRGLDRAISSAGGVALDALDDGLMLKTLPGVFLAGEMLDWEAPTGGYLLQASLASGVVAARAALGWLGSTAGRAPGTVPAPSRPAAPDRS